MAIRSLLRPRFLRLQYGALKHACVHALRRVVRQAAVSPEGGELLSVSEASVCEGALQTIELEC